MICRLCLTETEFCLPLKNAKTQEKDEETKDIAEIIRKHFDLELDINSDFVCTVCWQQISEFHTFYLFIEEKQKEFRQQSTLPVITGTRNDSTDNEHEVVMKKEVAAQDGNGIHIKHECLMDINTPMIAENSLKQWTEEATENLHIKNEFIAEVDIEAPNLETSATATENASENESEMGMIDENDEVDMKNESLIEISSPMITENSLSQWNKKSTHKATENNEDIDNVELIDPVHIESASCKANANDIDKTECIQQTKIAPTEAEKQALDKETSREKSVLIIAKHAGILKCELCAQTVETFGNLKQHFKKEHDRRGYITCCDKRYYLSSTYAEHLEWHANPSLWKCGPCSLVYSCGDSYDNHLLQVHSEAESLTIQCSHCPAKFSRRYLWRQHDRRHRTESKFKCNECSKEFKTLKNLSVHKKIFHLRAYETECDICGEVILHRSQLNLHKVRVHAAEEYLSFQCPSCPRKFASKKQLNRHIKDSHCNKKFKCNECSKEFKTLNILSSHKRSIHLRAYETECDICGEVILNRSQLNLHKVRVHAAEEYLRFQCPSCPKKFVEKKNINRHIKKVHSKQKLKCDECDKEFKSLCGLTFHKKSIHLRAYITECDICGKLYKTSTNCKIHKARIHGVFSEHGEFKGPPNNSKAPATTNRSPSVMSALKKKTNT